MSIVELFTLGAAENAVDIWAKVREVNHNIQWFWVILCGKTIYFTSRALSTEWFSRLSKPVQNSFALLIKVVIIPFCVILLLVQFKDLWYPPIESLFELIEDLL